MAGPYCAVYSVVMLLACAAAWIMSLTRDQSIQAGEAERRESARLPALDGRKTGTGKSAYPRQWFWVTGLICVAVPLLLYLWSNSYAVEDHADTVDIGMLELAVQAPGFFPRFLLKSLASMAVGGETITEWIGQGKITDGGVYLMGILLAAGYLLALYLNLRCRIWQRTMMPILLLTAGMGNHAIVLVSRYIFVNENYGMSSRYALQYQAGILGIILTFACAWQMQKGRSGSAGKVLKGAEQWLVRTAVCGF